MPALSAAFREQARVDLDMAQAIAKRSASGHALGASMFLAQQCVEKQLKSTLLKLGEAMGHGGDAGALKRLSHPIYPSLPALYGKYVGKLATPHNGAKHVHARNACFTKRLSELWKRYASPKSPWLVDMWKNSLNVELSPAKLRRLNLFSDEMTLLYRAVPPSGQSFLVAPPFGNEPAVHTEMRSRVRSKRQIRKLRSEHQRKLVQKSARNADVGMTIRRMLDPGKTNHFRKATPEGTRSLMAKRGVVEFGFGILRDHVRSYVQMFPHTVMGRYPTRLDNGRLTTDVYESQEDSVLYSLYVTIQHDYDSLCEQASGLDELCKLGHAQKYW